MNTKAQSVADLTALLEDAKKNERLLEEQKRREKAALRKKFLATHPYIYAVSACQGGPTRLDWGIMIETQDTVYVSQKINMDKYYAFTRNRSTHDIIPIDELEKSVGIQYYLTKDGIIHHSGGGTLVLKTPQLCSDAEWEWLKAGNIPVKFLRMENNDE